MHVFHRTILILLALVMVLSVLPVQSRASERQSVPEEKTDILERDPEYLYREISFIREDGTQDILRGASARADGQAELHAASEGSCGSNLRWSLSDTGVLTISGTGDMTDFITSNAPWHYSKVLEVVIEKGVTSIGDYAFYNCTDMTAATIADTVKELGFCAFAQCSALTEVTLPDSVTVLGPYAFADCTSLKALHIPAKVSEIGYGVLRCSTSLTDITVDKGNTHFCTDASKVLYDRQKTRLIASPAVISGEYAVAEGVTLIDDSAFFGCTGLTAVVLPESLEKIGYVAFYECSGLKEVQIPGKVCEIGDDVFSNCSALEKIRVDSKNATFSSDTYGILYNKQKTATVKAPEGITAESVVLPDSVQTVGDYTFIECINLKQITLGQKVQVLGKSAFAACTGLSEIVLPDRVTDIDFYAFCECDNLEQVVLGPNVKFVGSYSFAGCDVLREIDLPDSVVHVGSAAFHGCSGLRYATLGNNIEFFGSGVFEMCSSLEEIDLPDCIQDIPFSAFYYCTSLRRITMGPKVASVGGSAFTGCASLTEIQLPDGMETISDYAFAYCDGLKHIDLPDSVTAVGYRAFYKCVGLEQVNLGSGLDYLGEESLAGCTALTRIFIPKAVSTIEANAFMDAVKLEAIEVDSRNADYCSREGVLFSKDLSVLEVFPGGWPHSLYLVPEKVTQIRENAFRSAQNLANIQFQSDAPDFGQNCFKSVEAVAVYPGGNSTWTQDVLADYGGDLSWYTDSTAPEFVKQPEFAVQHCQGSQTLKALAAGDRISYQWQYRTSDADTWKNCEGEIRSRITLDITKQMHGWQYRCKASSPDNGEVYSRETAIHYTVKLENLRNARYQLEDLVMGVDGIYRTPEGRKMYIAVDNRADGGITFQMGGRTIRGFFNLKDDHPLVMLMDEEGYAVLTDESLTHLDELIPQGISLTMFLFYDGEAVEEILASGWSGYTQWRLTDDGILTVYGKGNMKNYGYGGGQPWLAYADQIRFVTVEKGVTAIGSGAFMGLTNLEAVMLPESGLKTIGEAAFYGCSALKEITIPEGVYTVWSYTFKGCTSLESVKFPKTLIKIDQGAFENCTALASVSIPRDVNIIGSWSFKGCTGLTEADLSQARATEVREGAFKNCNALTTVHFPANIQKLGDSAFYGIGAELFTIPATVTEVGPWCFARAYSLKDLYFDGNAPTIGEGAFNKITLTVHYPSGNATWTAEIMQDYGGTVTWTAN